MEDLYEILNADGNQQLELAYNFVQFTNRNVFLTGKAGTGKTTFLKNLKKVSPKRMIIVAPTGVAAINAGGVTIHSFFQIPFGPFIPFQNEDSTYENSRKNIKKFSRNKINIIKSLDLLVIDEISMVRADLLDAIDEVLRRFKDSNKAFGGVQLLMIGDIQQLAPVVKDDEWNLLREWYESIYFFSSRALMQTKYVTIELKYIYRQSDKVFIDLLNKVRDNKMDENALRELNKRYNPEFAKNAPEGYMILTTHNYQAQSINRDKLNKINSKAFNFKAEVEGDFPEHSFPTDYELTLRKGAQVMFIKNDPSPEKLFYNGKIGVVEKFDKDTIYVKCHGDNDSLPVGKHEWQNAQYFINEESGEIEEKIAGKFIQYPLKLAWAITIHKSQGLTFEKAIIDANSAFAHGQVYVALSRCKTLEGMVLSSMLSSGCTKSDSAVLDFSREAELNPPDFQLLQRSKYEYQQSLIFELFDFNQIRGQLGYCLKLYHENKGSLHSGLKENLEQMINYVNTDLVEVAEKFKNQIKKLLEAEPDAEKNQQLNERIKKASTFFAEKIESNFLKILKGIIVESDNKKVKKTLDNVLNRVTDALFQKTACLNQCKEGFSVKAYLDVRAKASIEKSSTEKTVSERSKQKSVESKETEALVNSIAHPDLFAELKNWRSKKAEEYKQPPFFVLHQRPLIEIAEKLPENIEELKSIKGIGKKKVQAFGQELLDMIDEYCVRNSIERNIDRRENITIEEKEKANTKSISLSYSKKAKV